ncbi:eukaryotic translation initiation factor 3 subunit A isoform X1 [Labeo rohita]|uniref:Eukaryotic translation initiation factor 3 subunit A n=1 Tax=Labeo rohita TaxID=84645 RepID=A0A498L5W0_LABRO|nr:eukaryotic translation initiation factor 3 subunit A isoform X1 [Labeo rohita]RXN28291.1 eukaryotic translation initiation factor 3 subunit A isoform X1 [Labeo rohita]
MPAYFQRPENALKRANEFLEVGKKQPALDVLYDVIKSKKHRTWQKIHEPIMLKYLELCVDLRKSHLAKEGLYQYKNICQQVNIKSLEDVVRAYLKLAEEKTETAKEESQQMVLDIEDLDNIQTPESVLLSAVSGEDTQDRTDRLLLTPWVKFLWESYRQCLDLLRNNSKVERLYHDIAQQAFKFCLQYTRKAEFRKLCDNLRMHLGQIQRHHNQSTAINLNNPESQSMHLETRLVQLDSAISMELWQEAFKAVEDIHGLFALSKKPPKPQLMANYYNKVSTVFWKSGNALFHACTLHRLYHLSREMRKNLTQEEMQRMSTRVLLATLSIPITPERTDIARLLDMDGIIVEKHRRLATLLGLQSPPTRQSLINDMVRFNLLQYVVPDVKELYNWLEVDFHPLKLCGRVTKVLNWVRDQAEKESDLQQYVPHLQNNTILRLLQQVAQIYQSIEFSRLASLIPFVDAFQLERSIVDAARHCDLQVRIDHTSRTLSFGSDLNYSTKEDSPVGPFLQNMPSEQIRNQLTAMSSSLAKAIQVIKPPSMLQEHEEQSQQAITAYLKNARKEHQRILARRQTIEERKERLESLNIQREKEELEQREAELQKVRKAEEERLRQEAKEREKERIMQEHEQIKKKTVRERLEQIKKTELGAKAFKDIDIEDLEELDPDFIMAKQVEQLEKEKKELQERLKNQEKKIDYFERAKRLEEIPLIKKAYEEQRIKDMELWEQQEEERITNMKMEREKALEHKQRMSRMMEDKENFLSKIKAARSFIYEEKLKQFQERLVEERKKRLEERKKQRKEDRRKAFYRQKEEEAQRIHEEQLKKEREERERLEQEQREEEEREYQERLRKLEEQERKQRARQQEIEERERRKEEERRAPEEKPTKDWSEREESGWRKRGTGVRRAVKAVKAVKTMIEKTVTVKCPSGEEQTVLVVVVQMTEDSAVALMKNEVHAEEVMRTVDPDGALMMTVGPGGALTMTEVTVEAMMTVDQGVEWMTTVAPDEVMTTVAQEEALMTTVGPVEAWMNPEGLDVAQMMTGAPEEEGMMRGEAAGVWMTLAHVVEMMLDLGNLLGDQVDGESERRLGKKAGDLLVMLAMMMVSVREKSVMREIDLENADLPDFDRDDRRERRDMRDRRDDRDRDRDHRGPSRDLDEGGSWRRSGDERRDERKDEREAPPRPRDREREGGEKSTWRSDKDKENPRRTKNETDDDGWTTVRR